MRRLVQAALIAMLIPAGAQAQDLFEEAGHPHGHSKWVMVRLLPLIQVALEGDDVVLVESIDHPAKSLAIKLDDTDVKRAKQMMAYAWFDRRGWQREMKRMLREGVKFELEALSAKGISFISEEYLPRKIRNRDYLV